MHLNDQYIIINSGGISYAFTLAESASGVNALNLRNSYVVSNSNFIHGLIKNPYVNENYGYTGSMPANWNGARLKLDFSMPCCVNYTISQIIEPNLGAGTYNKLQTIHAMLIKPNIYLHFSWIDSTKTEVWFIDTSTINLVSGYNIIDILPYTGYSSGSYTQPVVSDGILNNLDNTGMYLLLTKSTNGGAYNQPALYIIDITNPNAWVEKITSVVVDVYLGASEGYSTGKIHNVQSFNYLIHFTSTTYTIKLFAKKPFGMIGSIIMPTITYFFSSQYNDEPSSDGIIFTRLEKVYTSSA